MQSSLQGVHAQGDVHSWAVGEEGGESSLHEQAEDQDPVSETEQAEIKQQLRRRLQTIRRLTHVMPCWNREFLLVLQMMRSAHWTTTMLLKKAVWQVNSMIFLCS